ncbi:hypothetical protein P692DRAFT_20879763 [Suillus brevipes Sb2]|nr:hypothetical protein P692DRAFT_20879763 [Suillus brevipes Sb2]
MSYTSLLPSEMEEILTMPLRKGDSRTLEEADAGREDRGNDIDEEDKTGKWGSKADSESEGDDEPSSKHAKTVDVKKPISNLTISLPIQKPSSPISSQFQDKYVDLVKVLDSAHTTELDPKKTHVIDDEIELALRVSKASSGIKTSSDHNIAFKQPSSPPFALVPIPPHPHLLPEEEQIGEMELEEGMISVINGIEEPVRSWMRGCWGHITKPIALTKAELNEDITHGQHFKRKGVWGAGVSGCSRTVSWTETAAPLPHPPPSEFLNHSALHTIRDHLSLFKVSTPIQVDVSESLLSDHPNQPFVHSVCTGLREGFWPFANTHPGEWPITYDNSDRPPKTEDEKEFLRVQIDHKVEVGRYSEPFGPGLLPGMYSMPIDAVPKPGTNKHRLVTNHSAGKHALNLMISREDIVGVMLDNVHDLANGLRVFRHRCPHASLHLWKADVSEAYRHMPMHPLWQIKQIIGFWGRRFVDRCNIFGGRASQCIYHALMSLVIWIAIFKILIHFLYIYVDDSFSFEDKHSLELYAPYQRLLPANMVKWLRLWDAIGLLHEERKQVFGLELPIIGFDGISDFAQQGSRCTLRDFQCLAGWLNWALNVYPLLWPGLLALYAKTSVEGVFFFKLVSWSYSHLLDSVMRVYTDVSGWGMGFWFPSLNLGFQSPLPVSAPTGSIFDFEALAVTSALLEAITQSSLGQRVAIFTDNLNTVAMFNSLTALPPYDWMLMVAVDAIISTKLDFRVFFVPGAHNVIADHLSRWNPSRNCLWRGTTETDLCMFVSHLKLLITLLCLTLHCLYLCSLLVFVLACKAMQSEKSEVHPLGDPGPVSPTMQSIATTGDRRRAAHRELVKQGTLDEENARTGRHKHARVETNEAAGSTNAAQPQGDELGKFNIDNDDYNAHQDQDESEPPVPQPDTNHQENKPLPNAPSRSPSPPDPVRDDDIELPQQNIDQHVHVNVDIDELERLAVLPKQKDAIAFIQALQHAMLDDPCVKLNEAALHRLQVPLREQLIIEDPSIRHAITTYFALEHSANKAYKQIRKSAACCFEGAADVPSHTCIERLIANIQEWNR